MTVNNEFQVNIYKISLIHGWMDDDCHYLFKLHLSVMKSTHTHRREVYRWMMDGEVFWGIKPSPKYWRERNGRQWYDGRNIISPLFCPWSIWFDLQCSFSRGFVHDSGGFCRIYPYTLSVASQNGNGAKEILSVTVLKLTEQVHFHMRVWPHECVCVCFLVMNNWVWQPVFSSYALKPETSVIHLNTTATGNLPRRTRAHLCACTHTHTHTMYTKARAFHTNTTQMAWNID